MRSGFALEIGADAEPRPAVCRAAVGVLELCTSIPVEIAIPP